MISCPYKKFDLVMALMKIIGDCETPEDFEEKMGKKLKEFGPDKYPWMLKGEDKAEVNKRVAKDNGIDLKTLIDSPNYSKLMESWSDDYGSKLRDVLKADFNYDDVQAWAILIAINAPHLLEGDMF